MAEEFAALLDTGQNRRVTLEEQGLVEGIAESIGPDGCPSPTGENEGLSDPLPTLLEIRSAEVVHLRGEILLQLG